MGSSNGESFNECCMCGDYGLPSHLFRCKRCGFRSQHEYCSDLYPEAKSYHLCNWCLAQKEDVKKRGEVGDCHKGRKDQTKIKAGAKMRIIRRTRSEEISNGGSIVKQVFRNKARRYKLLDEVS